MLCSPLVPQEMEEGVHRPCYTNRLMIGVPFPGRTYPYGTGYEYAERSVAVYYGGADWMELQPTKQSFHHKRPEQCRKTT